MNIWYQELIKPPLTPPAEYFSTAWGILYTLMLVAFFIVLSKPHNRAKYIAVYLFIVQLIINFTWSYVFFEIKSINLALIDVILLFLLLTITIYYFFKVSKTAAIFSLHSIAMMPPQSK